MGSEQEDYKRKAVAEPIVAIEGLWDDDDVYYIIVRCYRR
jgi:hypothetical protein